MGVLLIHTVRFYFQTGNLKLGVLFILVYFSDKNLTEFSHPNHSALFPEYVLRLCCLSIIVSTVESHWVYILNTCN